MKKFCIIAVDYENHVPRTRLEDLDIETHIQYGRWMDQIKVTSIHKGLKSFASQTFKDFNLIICHDGPKSKAYEEEGIDFKSLGLDPIILNTEKRMNDWGHSSRDLALKYAYENELGEYFLVINIDNYLYENALQEIAKSINEHPHCLIHVYNIIQTKQRDKISERYYWHPTLLRGVPIQVGFIDVMQFVAHRFLWKKEGYWYDKRRDSDGFIFEKIAKKYRFKEIFKVLGINY